MSEVIIVAILGGITSIIGNWILSLKETRKDKIRRARREQFLDSKLEVIDKKLEEHNHYAEKLGSVEQSLVSIKKDIEYLRKEK